MIVHAKMNDCRAGKEKSRTEEEQLVTTLSRRKITSVVIEALSEAQ